MNRAARDPSQPDQPHDVAAEIEEAAHSVQMEGVAGAALRSMLISAIVVGGLAWLWRALVRRRFPDGKPEA